MPSQLTNTTQPNQNKWIEQDYHLHALGVASAGPPQVLLPHPYIFRGFQVHNEEMEVPKASCFCIA